MLQVGTDAAGFSLDFPQAGGIVVVGWGFWSLDVAASFASTVRDACRGRARGAALLLDMGKLKPMRDEGQQSFSELLRALPGLGISRTSIVTTNPLIKLQLVRLVAETGTQRVEWVSGTDPAARGT